MSALIRLFIVFYSGLLFFVVVFYKETISLRDSRNLFHIKTFLVVFFLLPSNITGIRFRFEQSTQQNL